MLENGNYYVIRGCILGRRSGIRQYVLYVGRDIGFGA